MSAGSSKCRGARKGQAKTVYRETGRGSCGILKADAASIPHETSHTLSQAAHSLCVLHIAAVALCILLDFLPPLRP